MRFDKVTFLFLILILAVSVFAGCSPAVPASGEQGSELVFEYADDPAGEGEVIESGTDSSSEAASVAPLALEAQRTVLEGTVRMLPNGETEFVPVTGTQPVAEGDIVRTGADGVATILFAENTEATLFPNTQIEVHVFQQLESGATEIILHQAIGRACPPHSHPHLSAWYCSSCPSSHCLITSFPTP